MDRTITVTGTGVVTVPPDCARISFGVQVQGVNAQDALRRSNEAMHAIVAAVKEYYRGTPFVQVRSSWPSVKDVAGTNMAHLCLRKEGSKLFVASVIDNLTKGAAGGGVQWMNALFAFDRAEGLRIPGLGWA